MPHETIGDYRLLEIIGDGGMSTVHKARLIPSGEMVAVKVLRGFMRDRQFRRYFLREVYLMNLLQHPAIVPLKGWGEDDEGQLYLVMPLFAGSLQEQMQKHRPCPLVKTLEVIHNIALGLDFIHKHTAVHRDIKPSNILYDWSGKYYIADFGLAKLLDDTRTLARSPIGTVAYISPEQIDGNKAVPQSDVYALGVVVFEMLAGNRPYQGTNIEIIAQHLNAPIPSITNANPAISAAVDNVVRKALSKAPNNRYSTAGEFALALQDAANKPSSRFWDIFRKMAP